MVQRETQSDLWRMKGILALLLAVLATSRAQLCESPQVWEARVFEFYQEGSSQEPTTVIRGQESYDAPNLRRRFFEEADRYNERDYYDNIYLHKEQEGYRINLRTRECERFVLQEPFPYIEVPSNATLDYTFYLGSSGVPGNSVEMNYFSDSNERGYYRGVWTAKDCIPYIDSYISSYPTPHYRRATIYDVTLGIANPDVFVPPSNC